MTGRRPAFTKAEIERACKAAPGYTIELVAPDGTVLRLVPDSGTEAAKYKVARKPEVERL